MFFFPDGMEKALIIEMCLKSSTYATMALREILTGDTSAEAQAALSASYNTKTLQSSATVGEEIIQTIKSEDTNLTQ